MSIFDSVNLRCTTCGLSWHWIAAPIESMKSIPCFILL